MEIILAIGEEDAFVEDNRRFSQVLWDQNVWHALHIQPGEAHCAYHWRRWVRELP